MAVIPVPRNAFSLTDVKASIESHTSETVNSLQTAFDKAENIRFSYYFDRDAYAPANSLKRFAGYGSTCLLEVPLINDTVSKKFPSGTRPYGLWINSPGYYVYIISDYNKAIRFYLSTAWDITSIQSSSDSKTLTANKDYHGFYMNPNNLQQFYTINVTDKKLERWDSPYVNSLGDATYHSSFNLNITDGGGITAFTFSKDGTKLYLLSSHENVPGQVYKRTYMYQFTLTTAWSLSSYSLVSKVMFVDEGTIIDACFNSNGTRLYIVDNSGPVTQFELNAAPWAISGIENSKESNFTYNCYTGSVDPNGGLYIREIDNGSRIIGVDLYAADVFGNNIYHFKRRKRNYDFL